MKTTNLLIIVAAMSLFGYFVWPGPWEYRNLGELPTRTNRLTGEVQYLRGTWMSLDEMQGNITPDPKTTDGRMFSSDELGLLSAHAEDFSIAGYFRGSLYNPTPCTVDRLVVYIAVGNTGEERRFSTDLSAKPQTTESFSFRAAGSNTDFKITAWGLDSAHVLCPRGYVAKGTPSNPFLAFVDSIRTDSIKKAETARAENASKR